MTLDKKAHCLKYGYKAPLSSAVSVCAKDGARPPLPKNAKENAKHTHTYIVLYVLVQLAGCGPGS